MAKNETAPKTRFTITDEEKGTIRTDKDSRALLNEVKDFGKTYTEENPNGSYKRGWDMLTEVMTDADIMSELGQITSLASAKRVIWRALQPFAKARIEEDGHEEAAAA